MPPAAPPARPPLPPPAHGASATAPDAPPTVPAPPAVTPPHDPPHPSRDARGSRCVENRRPSPAGSNTRAPEPGPVQQQTGEPAHLGPLREIHEKRLHLRLAQRRGVPLVVKPHEPL